MFAPPCILTSGTRAVRGRYVRIASLKRVYKSSGPVLNLAEVQAFSPSGKLLEPVGAKLSSTVEPHSASRCIDDPLLQDALAICHSNGQYPAGIVM